MKNLIKIKIYTRTINLNGIRELSCWLFNLMFLIDTLEFEVEKNYMMMIPFKEAQRRVRKKDMKSGRNSRKRKKRIIKSCDRLLARNNNYSMPFERVFHLLFEWFELLRWRMCVCSKQPTTCNNKFQVTTIKLISSP